MQHTSRIFLYSLVFLGGFFSPKMAIAAVSEVQISSLKASLQEMLDYQKEVNEAFGNVLVMYEGEMKAVAENDYVTVNLPRILIKNKDKSDPNIVDIGIISMNAVPDVKPGLWKIMMTIPSVISVKDNTDSDLDLMIGSQSVGGIYSQTLGYFLKLDMNLMDLSATEAGKDLGFKIAKINTLVNLDEDSESRLSGPISASIENLTITDEDSSFHIGKLGVDANLKKMKPVTLTEYKAIVIKHKATFESLKSLDTNDGSSKIESQAVVDMVFDLYRFVMNGFDVRVHAHDITVDTFSKESGSESTEELGQENEKPAKTDGQNEKFTISEVHFGFGFNEMESDAGSLSTDIGYSGVTLFPVDPQYDGVMPTDTKISIQMDKLPIKSVANLLKNTISSAAANPEMASIVGLGLLAKLPALFSQAGTELSVKDNFIKGGLYGAYLEGKILTDLTAVTSFTGKFTGRFDGLDELIAKIRENEKKEDSYTPEEYADLASTLETIKGYGTSSSSMMGGRSYTYAIEMTPKGTLQINSKNVDLFPPPPSVTQPEPNPSAIIPQ